MRGIKGIPRDVLSEAKRFSATLSETEIADVLRLLNDRGAHAGEWKAYEARLLPMLDWNDATHRAALRLHVRLRDSQIRLTARQEGSKRRR
jgi:hypothetical protein